MGGMKAPFAVVTIALLALAPGGAASAAAEGPLDPAALQAVQQQAGALEETAASLEELSSMTRQNFENARQANDLATTASQTAEQGRQATQRMGAEINVKIAGALHTLILDRGRIVLVGPRNMLLHESDGTNVVIQTVTGFGEPPARFAHVTIREIGTNANPHTIRWTMVRQGDSWFVAEFPDTGRCQVKAPPRHCVPL